jgi:uncharacterized protein involved in exopolysaccharide biosynthesis
MENELDPAPGAGGSFWESLAILIRWRNFILVNVFVVTMVTLVITLIVPKWYRSTASILPPKERDLIGSIAGGSAGSLLKGLTGRGGTGQNAYNYFAILKSRSAMESVVRKFDLITVYGIGDGSLEKAIKELVSNTAFESTDDDNITIEVLDRDPERAAAIANYFVDILNSMSIDLATREARNNREFIEKRVNQARGELHASEDSLQSFQERSGMIVMTDAGTGGGGVAELYGMKAKKEIELGIVRMTVAPDDPKIRQLENELSAISHKLDRFPGLGIGSLRLVRSIAIQQKILEYLTPMFEQAKVDEQKDVPVLLVLDKAVAAERKVKPQRALIVSIAFAFSLVAFTVAAFLLQGFVRQSNRGNPVELQLHTFALRCETLYRIRKA